MTQKSTLLLLLAAGAGWLTLTSYSSGPGTSATLDASQSGCGGGGCHSSPNAATVVQPLQLTDLSTGQTITGGGQYVPGHTYTVTLTGSNTSTALTHFGFQTTARNTAGQTAGSVTVTNSSATHIYSVSNRQGIEHSIKVAKNGSGLYTQSWRWTAPAAGTGNVRFFTALNAVDNNSIANTNDISNTNLTELTEGTSSAVNDMPNASLLALSPNPAKDYIRIDTRGWRAGDYSVTIFSTSGAVAMQQNVQHTGADVAEVKLPELSTGWYGVRVQGGGRAQTAPLFVH